MPKKTITIEDLARMINEGFKTTTTKEDLKEVKQDVATLRSEMKTGFDRIEHLLLEEQKRKIENLETRMKNSKTPSPSSHAKRAAVRPLNRTCHPLSLTPPHPSVGVFFAPYRLEPAQRLRNWVIHENSS